MVFTICWLLSTLIAFRYTGYHFNHPILQKREHEGAIICIFCRCVECGEARSQHTSLTRIDCRVRYDDRPSDADLWRGMHPTAALLGLVTAVLWPILLCGFMLRAGARATGLNEFQYFKPTPEIKSREERRAAREAETKVRIKALETRNAALEKELGIG